jgi:hypothetical protein
MLLPMLNVFYFYIIIIIIIIIIITCYHLYAGCYLQLCTYITVTVDNAERLKEGTFSLPFC